MIDSLSITQVTKYIKNMLEGDTLLQSVWLKGEISNYTLHSSGHQYFSLKDEGATIKCVKFKNFGYSPAQQAFKTGDKVLVHGSIDLYLPQGSYQLRVTQIHLQGLGDLYQQFELLKNKLAEQGLFNADHKKRIPSFPNIIGIVSSPTGAVIQDILNTIERRYPYIKIILAPALMQGETSAQTVIHALQKLEAMPEVDTIIIARGGGSMEDLWSFNNEQLIREIYNCNKPIISAIGHETDFTLCDLAADLRAPTPTAAAELAVPDRNELLSRLAYLRKNMERHIEGTLAYYFETLDKLKTGLHDSIFYSLENKMHRLEKVILRLETANPLMPLQKGFTLTTKNGNRIKSSKELQSDDEIETLFIDGTVKSLVK
jgi:exodeoxyribonuclease VII large subunit